MICYQLLPLSLTNFKGKYKKKCKLTAFLRYFNVYVSSVFALFSIKTKNQRCDWLVNFKFKKFTSFEVLKKFPIDHFFSSLSLTPRNKGLHRELLAISLCIMYTTCPRGKSCRATI